MDGVVVRDDETGGGLDQDPGTTLILTETGWETTDYLEPDEDWGLQPDGSYLSPDGFTRTWPADAG